MAENKLAFTGRAFTVVFFGVFCSVPKKISFGAGVPRSFASSADKIKVPWHKRNKVKTPSSQGDQQSDPSTDKSIRKAKDNIKVITNPLFI